MITMILSIKLRNCGNPNENLQNMSADKKKPDWNIHPLDEMYRKHKALFDAIEYGEAPRKPTKADKEYYDRSAERDKKTTNQFRDKMLKWKMLIVLGLIILYILLFK